MPDQQNTYSQPQFSQQPPPYYYPQQKKSRWWIPVLIIGIILLFFVIIIAVFAGMVGSFMSKEPVEVKENTVLFLNYGHEVPEYSSQNPFAAIFSQSKQPSLSDILTAIRRAKYDDKIKGVYFKSSATSMSMSMSEEIQNALIDFKKSGKFIYAYLEIGSEIDYYNALIADKIYMPDEGILEMNGFGISSMFLKGLFDKVGIDFYVEGFEDFKSAGEGFSRRNFSDSSRLQIRALLDQRYNIFTQAVTNYRKMNIKDLEAALDRGIYTADTLKALGFIDEISTEIQVKDKMKKEVFGKASDDEKLYLITPTKYMQSNPKPHGQVASSDKQIAVIYGVGAIETSKSDNAFSNEESITPDKFISYLKKAREDKNVKIILLRINSPGGSLIGSDAIYNEIIKTKKVKPVYASMSSVAASGGYYIAMACDTIICHPYTITGSIGVISMIPNLKGLMDKLDITVDTLNTNQSSQFFNVLYPFSETDKAKFRTLSKSAYFRFVDKVSKHRKKSFDETRSMAKGRVWTGEDAKRLGLVDVLGGYQTAISLAKKRIGVPDSMLVLTKYYPNQVDEITALLSIFGLDDEDLDSKISFGGLLSHLIGVEPAIAAKSGQAIPDEFKSQFNYIMQLLGIAKQENVLMAMPQQIEIK